MIDVEINIRKIFCGQLDSYNHEIKYFLFAMAAHYFSIYSSLWCVVRYKTRQSKELEFLKGVGQNDKLKKIQTAARFSLSR